MTAPNDETLNRANGQGLSGHAANDSADSASLLAIEQKFFGPANPRHERVLSKLMAGRRLTNNSVRSIGGALNGPHIISELRDQGLCPVTELVMVWIKTIDRDGRHVRYGEYFLTAKGIAKVKTWEASQLAKAEA